MFLRIACSMKQTIKIYNINYRYNLNEFVNSKSNFPRKGVCGEGPQVRSWVTHQWLPSHRLQVPRRGWAESSLSQFEQGTFLFFFVFKSFFYSFIVLTLVFEHFQQQRQCLTVITIRLLMLKKLIQITYIFFKKCYLHKK